MVLLLISGYRSFSDNLSEEETFSSNLKNHDCGVKDNDFFIIFR